MYRKCALFFAFCHHFFEFDVKSSVRLFFAIFFQFMFVQCVHNILLFISWFSDACGAHRRFIVRIICIEFNIIIFVVAVCFLSGFYSLFFYQKALNVHDICVTFEYTSPNRQTALLFYEFL